MVLDGELDRHVRDRERVSYDNMGVINSSRGNGNENIDHGYREPDPHRTTYPNPGREFDEYDDHGGVRYDRYPPVQIPPRERTDAQRQERSAYLYHQNRHQ